MMGKFKGSWIVLATMLPAIFIVTACASDDPEPRATPVPTVASNPSIDIASLGVDAADLLELTGSLDIESALDDMAADSAPIDLPQRLPGAPNAPDILGILETTDLTDLTDLASDLPFTAEQFECLVSEIEIDTIQALVDGEVNSLRMLSFIAVLSTCGVDLSDLVN
ncbi:MAG TPA: hypothetical protein EYG13_01140 [Dehalococcoidia bacterium]|nr:hypothetical protein [Dehalococcoidia bacterium]